MSVISNLWNLFVGSPKTTHNKAKPDGNVEDFSDFGKKTRTQIKKTTHNTNYISIGGYVLR